MTKRGTKRVDDAEAFEAECAAAAKQRGINRELREKLDSQNFAEKVRDRMIKDLLRVYEHPKNKSLVSPVSRPMYRKLGRYCELMVTDVFGSHTEFLRAGGLQKSRTTQKTERKASLLHTHQRIADYAEKNVLSWVGKFDKKPRGEFDVIFGSDFHSAMVDPFAMDVFIDALKNVQPRVVVLGGDVWDFPTISRHRKLPGHFHLSLAEEIEFGRERILRRVREACPDATIHLIIGNHEYRLVNYIADAAPELAALPTINFGELLGLGEFEINLVCRSNFLAPYKADQKRDTFENWLVIGDCLVVTHGTSIAKNAAEQELLRFQMSGISGHCHRPHTYATNTLATGPTVWTSAPMMAGYAVGRDYVSNPSAWNMGFTHSRLNTRLGLVSTSIVPVYEGWATFAGHSYVPSRAALAARKKQWEIET